MLETGLIQTLFDAFPFFCFLFCLEQKLAQIFLLHVQTFIISEPKPPSQRTYNLSRLSTILQPRLKLPTPSDDIVAEVAADTAQSQSLSKTLQPAPKTEAVTLIRWTVDVMFPTLQIERAPTSKPYTHSDFKECHLKASAAAAKVSSPGALHMCIAFRDRPSDNGKEERMRR